MYGEYAGLYDNTTFDPCDGILSAARRQRLEVGGGEEVEAGVNFRKRETAVDYIANTLVGLDSRGDGEGDVVVWFLVEVTVTMGGR